MSSIRVYLDHCNTAHIFRFRRPNGMPAQIPGLRLKVYANLSQLVRPGPTAPHAAFPLCVLDTGAYLTIIPERVWSQFRPGVVTPLPFDPTMPQYLRVIDLPGGQFPYELAEVPIRLQDLVGGVMDVAAVAQLTRDGGRLTIPVLIGLRGGGIDDRILRSQPDPAAPHGQAWVLEDP